MSFAVHLLTLETLLIRAAEDLLSQIQKHYQKPQEELEILREAASILSTHNHELQAATELVRVAEVKTQESGHLLLIVSANLREFSVSFNSSLLSELVP